MPNPAQLAALNHFAHLQNKRNCSIHESCTTVSKIEDIGSRLYATVVSEDVVRGIFSTHSVIAIGPRGAIRFCRTSRYVY